MRHLSAIVQYEFLKPIEELLEMKAGVYIFYCARKNMPYFFTAYFNKDKGLAMLPWTKSWELNYSQNYLNGITNFRYNFSYDTLDNLKKDNIEFYCRFKDYKNFKLSKSFMNEFYY